MLNLSESRRPEGLRLPPWRALRHALIVISAFALLFIWLFGRPIVERAYLVESDLFDSFLPRFLATFSPWSSFEYAGYLYAASSDDFPFYPLHVIFRHLIGSWNGFIISAYVIAAAGTYAYVYSLTKSRLASACAGLAYALSEAMMERIAHINIVHASAWVPVIMLAVDRLRGTHQARWIAVGAFAAGSAFLIGHPQAPLYACTVAALYALVGGIAERARPRYYLAVAALFVLGALLSAVKLLPQVDVIAQMARQEVSFGQFVGHANTPAQMLSMLFPAIEHEGREAPTYVGLATLVLALLAATQIRRNWRAAFWLVVAVAAFMLGTGNATPLSSLMFEIPLYDRFRIVGRHLFLASFACAVLAGIAISALQSRVQRAGPGLRTDFAGPAGGFAGPGLRTMLAAVAVVGVAMAAGAIAISVAPDRFVLDPRENIVIQIVIGAATAAACVVFAMRPQSRMWAVILISVLIVDLVHALPYTVRIAGLEAPVVPRGAVQPSVHVTRLKAELDPLYQRLLSPRGTGADELIPAGYGRLWGVPLLGGFSQLLPARHSALAMMGANGPIDPTALGDSPILDMLAVKYVVMKAVDFGSEDTLQRHDVTWASEPLGLAIGEPECGQKYPRSVSYGLPAGVRVAAVGIAMHLRCGEDEPQGHAVGMLRVSGAGAEPYERELRAGIEVAERGLSDPALKRRSRHTMATLFDPDAAPPTYYLRLDLPQPLAGARLEIQITSAGWLEIERLTVIDDKGQQFPQRMPGFIMRDEGRWRSLPSFFTSETTDRMGDKRVEGEREYFAFENLRALPRAWVAQEVIPLTDEDQLLATRYSYLPNGQRFDPTRTAMVDAGALEQTSWRAGPGSAQVTSARDEFFSIDVSTVDGGFLVLSENWYPSWQARIDGQPVPIHRANVSLQGVVVPAGRHTVTFEFVSRAFQAGAVISALTLLTLVFVAWRSALTTACAP